MNGWTLYLLILQTLSIIIIPLQIDRPRDPVTPGLGAAMAAFAIINFFAICKATGLI
jgi:hypothetical protein